MKNVIPCFCVFFRKLTLRRISQSLGHRPPTTPNPMMDMDQIKSRLMHGFCIFFLRHTTHTQGKKLNKKWTRRTALNREWFCLSYEMYIWDLFFLKKCIFKFLLLQWKQWNGSWVRGQSDSPRRVSSSGLCRFRQSSLLLLGNPDTQRRDEIIRERRRAGQESWEQKPTGHASYRLFAMDDLCLKKTYKFS